MSLTYLSSAERRARAILDAYGSWPECWPDNERQTTLECIAHSAALQQYQSQIVDLDLRIQSAQASALPRQACQQVQAGETPLVRGQFTNASSTGSSRPILPSP